MDYPLYVPLYGLACILPFAIGVGFVLLARRTARGKHRVRLITISFASIIISLSLSVLTFYSVGGGFGPGAGLFWFSFPAAFVAFALALKTRHSLSPDLRRWYLAVASLLIPLSLLSVPILSLVPTDRCNSLDRIAATPLIPALEKYKVERGVYPKRLAELVPQYVPEIPTGPCHPLGDAIDSFIWSTPYVPSHYYLCKAQDRLLLGITFASGGFYQGYDLDSKEWLELDNIDQPCTPP